MPSLRLLEVDVEGMEAAVVAGATGLLDRHRLSRQVRNERP